MNIFISSLVKLREFGTVVVDFCKLIVVISIPYQKKVAVVIRHPMNNTDLTHNVILSTKENLHFDRKKSRTPTKNKDDQCRDYITAAAARQLSTLTYSLHTEINIIIPICTCLPTLSNSR
jgi:hypothetical protein